MFVTVYAENSVKNCISTKNFLNKYLQKKYFLIRKKFIPINK